MPGADGGIYGAIVGGPSKGPYSTGRKIFNVACLVWLLLLPLLVFGVLFGLMSFSVRHHAPWAIWLLVAFLAILCLYLVYSAWDCYRKYKAAEDGSRDKARLHQAFVMLLLLLLCVLGAMVFAAALGEMNYQNNSSKYYGIKSLNSYTNVNVGSTNAGAGAGGGYGTGGAGGAGSGSAGSGLVGMNGFGYGPGSGSGMTGAQLMDAGRVVFGEGTHVHVGLGSGFKDHKIYCVAPIVGPDNKTATGTYDLWAVGINCCVPNNPQGSQRWWCPDALDPFANAGLRLHEDHDRAYYRMAVQQVEAAFNIKAPHPIFFHWMQDPFTHTESIGRNATHFFLIGCGAFFMWQLFLVVCAAFYFIRHQNDDTKPRPQETLNQYNQYQGY